MQPEVPIASVAEQFRAFHRGSGFYNDQEGICYRAEQTWLGVLRWFLFDRKTAQFTSFDKCNVYAGFYRASLTVGIQIADSEDPDQLQVGQELQQLLSRKQERGELNNVVVLVKNPLSKTDRQRSAPFGWNIQNILVVIDGVIFVATRKGEIVRPVTDTSHRFSRESKEVEGNITAEVLAYMAQVEGIQLPTWDTQQCMPIEQN